MREFHPGVIRISTDAYPEHSRVEAAREGFGQSLVRFNIEPLPGQPFPLDAMFCVLPGLGLAVGTISPMRGSLTNDLIRGDDILFNVTLSGGRIMQQRGREAAIGPGEGGVTTSADPGVVTVHSTSRFISFRISRDNLKPIVGDLDACLVRTIPRDLNALRLLTTYAGLIGDDDALARPDIGGLVAAHFRDLISLTLGATRDATEVARGRGVRAARLRAIKADIMENLARNELSIGEVANRHGISPRYVHMLFAAEETSFTDFVLRCRLDRVHKILNDSRHAAQPIGTTAFACGFGDLSYFNRVFRRRYGATPSDVREAARNAGN